MTKKIQAVVFDIGETLVDETRHWAAVAQYAGIPQLTLMGVLGGLIERREHHRSLFGFLQIESVDPNIFGYRIEEQDLYPDVVSVLRQLKTAGYRIGITGNHSCPTRARDAIATPRTPKRIRKGSDGRYRAPNPAAMLSAELRSIPCSHS